MKATGTATVVTVVPVSDQRLCSQGQRWVRVSALVQTLRRVVKAVEAIDADGSTDTEYATAMLNNLDRRVEREVDRLTVEVLRREHRRRVEADKVEAKGVQV